MNANKYLKTLLITALSLFMASASISAFARYIPYKGSASQTQAPAEPQQEAKAEEPKVEAHSAQALEHAKVAGIHGDAGHADILTEHAEVALEHANLAVGVLEGAAKEHMSVAVSHIEEAIKHGKLGHAEMANEHIKMGIEHIEASIAS